MLEIKKECICWKSKVYRVRKRHYIVNSVPPYGTKYSNIELFEELTNELLNYDTDVYEHVLCGDFNAHMREESDISEINDYIFDDLDIDNHTQQLLDIYTET